MKLSIIMPVYNEKNVTENIKEIINNLDKKYKNFEIIVVDDGSKDKKSFIEAEKVIKNKNVYFKYYDKNLGKGNALKYGFGFAKGKYILFIDGDGEFNINKLNDFFEIFEQKKADIVIGNKLHPNSNVEYPLFRRLMSKIYRTLNKILFNMKIEDTQVGMKLFKREVLERILKKALVKRFAFDLEVLVIANKMKYKIAEAPVEIKHKFRSTINLIAVLRILQDTAAIFYRLKILRYYD